MRWSWLVVVACGSPAKVEKGPALPPRTPDAGVEVRTVPAGDHSLIDDEVVVLIFDVDPGETVTTWFREEVGISKLPLSPLHVAAIDERLLFDCDKATPRDDGACMARVGHQLGAKWLLWGALHDGNVDVQLIPVAHPDQHRNLTFALDGERSVHDAWIQLSAK